MSRPPARGRRRDRRGGTRRRAWTGAAIVTVAAVAVLAVWLGEVPSEGGNPARLGATAGDRPAGASRELVLVRGNPGWEALSEAERERAAREMSPEARAWLRSHRGVVREVARAHHVSPVALGGIVAAEKTLLVGRVDALGEELFRVVFGSLRERDLERWVARQESRYRQEAAGEAEPSRLSVRNPYRWTLGPAQVSFRLAVQYEPIVASRLGRRERSLKEVVRAVTSTPGNLEYAATLLAEAERAYRDLTGLDIATNPGVLATLYHLGAPTVRARRLAGDNAARAARGEPPQPPHVNYYGAFVNLHADEIARLLAE